MSNNKKVTELKVVRDAPKSVAELIKGIPFLSSLAQKTAENELVELPEFIKGIFELVEDGIKTLEDGKITISDAFHFIDFNVYVKAFDRFGVMVREELRDATDAQIEKALIDGKNKFSINNKKVEVAVEGIVAGVIYSLRLVAISRKIKT